MSVCVSGDLAWDEDDVIAYSELCQLALGADALCQGGVVCPLVPATELTMPWPRVHIG